MAIYEMVLGEELGYRFSHVAGGAVLGISGLRHIFQAEMSLVYDLLGMVSISGDPAALTAMGAGVVVTSASLDLIMDGLE